MSNLQKHDAGQLANQALNVASQIELEPIGTSPVLGGVFTDDPVQATGWNITAGVAAAAGVLALGGGVVPLMCVVAGTLLIAANDGVYGHSPAGQRRSMRRIEQEREEWNRGFEDDQPQNVPALPQVTAPATGDYALDSAIEFLITLDGITRADIDRQLDESNGRNWVISKAKQYREHQANEAAKTAAPTATTAAPIVGQQTRLNAVDVPAVVQASAPAAPIVTAPTSAPAAPAAEPDPKDVWSEDEVAMLSKIKLPDLSHLLADEDGAIDDDGIDDAIAEMLQDTDAIDPSKAVAAKLLALGTATPLQPVLVVGSPGSGKGMFSSAALSAAVQAGAEVWVIDPKSDAKEAGYWAGVSRHYLLDPDVQDDIGKQVLVILDEFAKRRFARKNGEESCDTPLILFIDEVNTVAANMTNSELATFGQRVITLAAQGRSQNAAIWIGAQAVTLEQLGIKGASNRDIFTQVVTVNGDDAHKAVTVLKNLGMEPERLKSCKAGQRYWLTQTETTIAAQLSEPPKVKWGSNVIDKRFSNDAPQAAPSTGDRAVVESAIPVATPKQPAAPAEDINEKTIRRVAGLIKDAGADGITRGAINRVIDTKQRDYLDNALALLIQKYRYKLIDGKYSK